MRAVAILWLLVMATGTAVSTATAGPCGGNVSKPGVLADCVTLDAVRAHQAALQAIADADGDTRFAGSPGDSATIDYIVAALESAGYDVTVQDFSFLQWRQTGPSALEQVAPGTVTYVENTDYDLLSHTESGDVTAPVTPVDLTLRPAAARPRTSRAFRRATSLSSREARAPSRTRPRMPRPPVPWAWSS